MKVRSAVSRAIMAAFGAAVIAGGIGSLMNGYRDAWVPIVAGSFVLAITSAGVAAELWLLRHHAGGTRRVPVGVPERVLFIVGSFGMAFGVVLALLTGSGWWFLLTVGALAGLAILLARVARRRSAPADVPPRDTPVWPDDPDVSN